MRATHAGLRVLPLARIALIPAVALWLAAAATAWVFFAGAGALWRDEVHSLNFATQGDLASLFGRLWLDSFPALFHLYLRAYAQLAASDLAMRIHGLLMTAAIGAIALWLARSLRRGPPLLLPALFLVNPIAIRTVGSVRAYGLGALLGVLFLGLFFRDQRAPSRGSFWAASGAALLAAHTLYQNAFLILTACVVGAGCAFHDSRDARVAARALAVGILPGLSMLPYVGVVRSASYWVVTQQVPVPWAPVHAMLVAVAGGGLLVGVACLGVALSLVAGLRATAVGSRAADRDERMLALQALLIAAGYVLAYEAGFVLSRIPPADHRFVPLLVVVAFALDLAVPREPVMPRLALGVVLSVLLFLRLPLTLEGAGRPQTNVDTVASAVTRLAQPADLVVLQAWSSGISFSRYFHADVTWRTIPEVSDHSIHRYDILRRKFESKEPLRDLLAELEATLSHGHRVFFVGEPSGAPTRVRYLPPAPHPRFGWFKGPYLASLQTIVSQYIAAHSTKIFKLGLGPLERADSHEDLPVFVAQGWRRSVPE